MTDRDREAFEAWWGPCDPQSRRRDYAWAGWEAGAAHAREAGAQEPVAVPARMTADEAWQDLCEKDDRTSIDYPGFALIRQDELAAYMAAAPVSPAADSGEEKAPLGETIEQRGLRKRLAARKIPDLVQCHECGKRIEAADAQWTEDESCFCPHHPLPTPAGEG